MNPWWLLLLLPASAFIGFTFAALLSVSARVERMVLMERTIIDLQDERDDLLWRLGDGD